MMKSTCYYCGQAATTKEHVPPKGIFPELKDSPNGKDYRTNLMTVPSCELHNLSKSQDDEYLLYVLVMSLPSNEVAKNQFLTKIHRAINKNPSLLRRFVIQYEEVSVHDTVTNKWFKTIAIQPEHHRLVSIFTSIAKGIYYLEKGTFWNSHIHVVIEFTLSFSDIKSNDKQEELVQGLDTVFSNIPQIGQNPEVFTYQFTNINGSSLCRFNFYGSSRVTVAYK